MEPITRRRFLVLVTGAAGLSGWAWWRGSADEPVSVESPTSAGNPTTSTEPTADTSTTTGAPSPTTTMAAVAATLEVIQRHGWGAREPTAEYSTHTIRELTVHHTATELSDNRRAPARLRGHQAYHQEQGWVDLAYHFAIDLDGNVYEARPYGAPGDTFTDYDPSGHFLPVLEGNYSTQHPTDLQLESLVRLLAWAAGEFGIDPATISGHRDHAATTCPGDNLYSLISDRTIERRVAERIAAGGVDLIYLRDEAALQRVAEIEA